MARILSAAVIVPAAILIVIYATPVYFIIGIGLIGTLYALLQNEQAYLADFYRNTPFTAGGILYEIWRRRQDVQGLARPGRSFDDPDFEEDFLEVIKVAGGISRFSLGSGFGAPRR